MLKLFRKHNSKRTAKERLLTVISRDRANVTADFILRLTQDMIAAVKYVEPDYDKISVSIERNKSGAYLCAMLPITAFKMMT